VRRTSLALKPGCGEVAGAGVSGALVKSNTVGATADDEDDDDGAATTRDHEDCEDCEGRSCCCCCRDS
jgi:hypothetical protein